MMMETKALLIMKTGTDYIRIKDNDYVTCCMDKASVFPLDKLPDVRRHVEVLNNTSSQKVAVFKLTITEEPFATF